MGLELDVTVPALTVFIQGILSFFSPCILPIIPLYIGYLSGGTTFIDETGQTYYDQKVIFKNTFFFIVGVSFAFFLLGLGFSAMGQFFTSNQMLFSRIGGIIVIMLGFMQLGVFDQPFGGREFKLPIKINASRMNPFTALLMGFTFSFAWTPCVGPALSTVLIMISSAKTTGTGMLLMAVYTLGFTIPFMILGIFTTKCLEFFKKNRKVVAYTVKIGAVLMILMGLMMFTGTMNGISSYLSSLGTNYSGNTSSETDDKETTNQEEASPSDKPDTLPAIDFSLEDQFGKTHTLADYEGKVIFLNFWATWCPPCVKEMPDIQKLYESYGLNEEDVVILGVASPNDTNQYTREGSREHVVNFLAEHSYTYPTIMDMTGELAIQYGISAYPTTFMIDVDGNVFGYVPGMLTYEMMENIIQQTLAAK